jgi:hypothetical protein
MGFFDSLSDMLEAALPWSQAEAEAPKEDDSEEKVSSLFSLMRDILDGMIGGAHGIWEARYGEKGISADALRRNEARFRTGGGNEGLIWANCDIAILKEHELITFYEQDAPEQKEDDEGGEDSAESKEEPEEEEEEEEIVDPKETLEEGECTQILPLVWRGQVLWVIIGIWGRAEVGWYEASDTECCKCARLGWPEGSVGKWSWTQRYATSLDDSDLPAAIVGSGCLWEWPSAVQAGAFGRLDIWIANNLWFNSDV